MSSIAKELEDVKKRLTNLVPTCAIIGAHEANVQIRIVRTEHKQCLCQFQFPPSYPEAAILIELKSKVFPVKVLDAITKVTEEEAKKLIGRPQVISLVKFINKFLEDNPLLVCSEEISALKKNIVQPQDEFRVKQKTGVVAYKINQDRYYLDVRISVPDNYPTDCVTFDFKGSNLPKLLELHVTAQAKEIARKCVVPPARKDPKAPPFKACPSLKKVVEYLSKESIHRFPDQVCPCCREKCLPDDPKDCEKAAHPDRELIWVYCGHMFHYKCLDDYMKTPPFTGGKKCPTCGLRIYHERWNISPELAEERWAHGEARKREIEEVSDFLDLM